MTSKNDQNINSMKISRVRYEINHGFFGIPIPFLISRIKHPRSLVKTNLLQLVGDKI